MRARRTAATTTALFATLALAGCEKPTPFLTVYSSGTAADTKASSWCFEVGEESTCREDDVPVPRVPVNSDGRIAVNVSHEVAERGWYLAAGGEPEPTPEQLQQRVQFEDYSTTGVPQQLLANEDGFVLEIVVMGGPEAPTTRTGLYRFQLVPD